jgi:hypothetical protein
MSRILGALCIFLTTFAGTAQAEQLIINFSSAGSSFLTTSTSVPDVIYANVHNGEACYEGEIYCFVNEGGGAPADSGYWNVAKATGNDWIAISANPNRPTTFASRSGEFFNLDSLWLAGGLGDVTLSIIGYANGNVVGRALLDINITAQEYFFDSFQGINSFSILSTGNATGMDNHLWALGRVTVTPVPEPETWAMLLAGLGIMGTIARRRQK